MKKLELNIDRVEEVMRRIGKVVVEAIENSTTREEAMNRLDAKWDEILELHPKRIPDYFQGYLVGELQARLELKFGRR